MVYQVFTAITLRKYIVVKYVGYVQIEISRDVNMSRNHNCSRFEND